MALALALLGCGSPALNAGFARDWRGPQTVLIGPVEWQYSMELVITLSDETATITPFCPEPLTWGPVKSVVAAGGGNSMRWSGTVRCWAVAHPDCPDVIPTYTSAAITLSEDGKGLLLQAWGTGEGCSRSWPLSSSFSGS